MAEPVGIVFASTITQSSPTTTSASQTQSTTSTGTSTHTVQVGGRQDPHHYSPHTIEAAIGDTILFQFLSNNHSVVQADYLVPCVPSAQKGYFNSGNIKVNLNNDGTVDGTTPTWSLPINDTEPTFFYCTALESCNVNGMVGAINPNKSMTWESQYQKALQAPYQLAPGESPPTEGSEHGSSSSSGSSSSHLTGGAIAGIVVGVVAFVTILVVLFFVLGRNRVYRQWVSSQDANTERTAHWALFGNSTGTPSWQPPPRKSDVDPGIAQMDDHPATATPMYSPDTPQMSGPHMSMQGQGSPPPHHYSPQSGWNWNIPGMRQQYQHPPAPLPQEPFELDSNSHK